MSMLPYLMEHFHPFRAASRGLDQEFGVGLRPEDVLLPYTIPQGANIPLAYFRPWRSEAAAQEIDPTISFDRDRFQVNLDVQHFGPNEISVRVTDGNTITVEGKHQEKPDEHGYISRQFVRRYVLPEGHDIEKVSSHLSSDGVLTITAPKVGTPQLEGRSIPIQHTGAPSKIGENKEGRKGSRD